MTKKNTPDSGFGNDELQEWESLQNVTFSKVFKTTSTFFVLEKTKLYYHLWTVGAILSMFIISFTGIALSLHEPVPPPNLIDFSNRTEVLAQFDSLRCLRNEQDRLYQDTAVGHTPVAEMLFGDPTSGHQPTVGYLYSAEIANSPYIESLLMQWQSPAATIFYTDSLDYNNSVWADNTAIENEDETAEKDWLKEIVKRREHRTLIDLYKDIPTLETPKLTIKVPVLDLTPIERIVAKRDNLQVTITTGALLSFAKYAPNTEVTRLRNNHTSPIYGLHYGVQLSKLIHRYSYLFAGFDRQVYYQNIEFTAERALDGSVKENLVDWRYAAPEYQKMHEIPTDTTIAGMQIRRLTQYNTFHSTQFKFGFGHTFEMDKWQWQPALGVAIGRINAAKGRTIGDDLSIVEYGVPDDIFQQLQLLSIVGLDAQYNLNEQLNLRIGYQYRQQWNNATYEEGLSLRPGFHYLSAGIQLKL